MKHIFKTVNLLLGFFIILLTVVLIFEYYHKKQTYFEEKIYDMHVKLQDKMEVIQNTSKVFLSNIAQKQKLQKILFEINSKEDFRKNKNDIYKLLNLEYTYLSQLGAMELRIYGRNNTNLLGFNNQNEYSMNFKNNLELQKLLELKKPIFSYEVDSKFEGFRYIYPIFYNEKYVGSLEVIYNLNELVKELNIFSDAKYSVILKKSLILNNLDEKIIGEKFSTVSYVDEFYTYINSKYHFYDELRDEIYNIKNNIDKKEAFAIDKSYNITFDTFIFYPLTNIRNENIAYIISKREDMEITYIFLSQTLKFTIGVLLLLFILYFYEKSKQSLNTIEQLREAIDKTTLVSKTDLRGKITYVNDAFIELSGYSKEELLDKPHNIVRHPDMTRAEFRDVWNTIQNKKVWHGVIKNRKKDGGYYIVDATIIPILDLSGNIREYIAIRHDITELENMKEILKTQLKDKNKTLEENRSYARQYEDAINNSTAIIKTDLDNNITYANEKFLEISGYSFEEIGGTDIKSMKDLSSLDKGEYLKIVDDIAKGKTINKVFTHINKNKEKYFVNTVIYPIRDLKNNIIEHIYIMYDITEIINLNQEIINTQKEVVFQMGAIGESRSKETGNHVKRVAEYSKLLALLYGLNEEEAELLKQASPMHDIGKVGIPDSILHKPAKLNPDEWEIMKTHSNLGYEMLRHSNRPILKAAATVANEHHEKYDGTGYPNGLKDEDIHIYGRITAIADVFDALGSDRCYKKAWELEKILEFFNEQKNKHFDPKLVELFIENLDKFLEIRDRFKDEF